MRKFRRFAPILAFSIVFAMATALAVPVINLKIQGIGEGSSPVVSPADNGAGNFVLDSNNPDYVSAIKVSFDQNIPNQSVIIVKIYNQTPSTVTENGVSIPVPMVTGQITLNSDLTAGTQISVPLSKPVEIKDIDSVGVIVQTPEQSP